MSVQISGKRAFDAVAEGAQRAVMQAMCNITDMPGTDTFETIKKAVREAATEWLNDHEDAIIEAIARAAAPSKPNPNSD